MKEKIYATNLANKPKSITPMYKCESRTRETNYVPTANAICRVKTEPSLKKKNIKPIKNLTCISTKRFLVI
jgi:hypothetical protein